MVNHFELISIAYLRARFQHAEHLYARDFSTRTKTGMVGVNVPIPVPVAYHSFVDAHEGVRDGIRETLERLANCLERAVHVGLQHHAQLVDLVGPDRGEEVLGRELSRRLLDLGAPLLREPVLGHRLRLALVLDDGELIARVRDPREPHDLDRSRGTGLLDRLAQHLGEAA